MVLYEAKTILEFIIMKSTSIFLNSLWEYTL